MRLDTQAQRSGGLNLRVRQAQADRGGHPHEFIWPSRKANRHEFVFNRVRLASYLRSNLSLYKKSKFFITKRLILFNPFKVAGLFF
jgi:hypothetical protein